MKNFIIKSLLCFNILIFISFNIALAQEDTKSEKSLESSLRISYTKKTDDSKILKAILTCKTDAGISSIAGADLNFYLKSDTLEQLLGALKTDMKGIVVFDLPKDLKFPEDSVRKLIFVAEYKGDGKYADVRTEAIIYDVQLDLNLSVIDSVNTMSVNAYTIGIGDTKVPVNEIDVYFYVTRLFNPLKIGEGWLEEGESSVGFPNDLPGDSSGNVTIIAKIEDHDEFGNVEKTQTINWGLKVPYVYTVHRGLGDVDAPLWMVYTLITLLSIVWLHYLYVILSVFKIKKIGKKVE